MAKSIFDFHSNVISDYRDFVRSFLLIADDRAREFINRALDEETHFWPEPLIQLSPGYAYAHTVDELEKEGLISRETAQIFRAADGRPFRLYKHQEEAIRKVLSGESVVITTGTGSGKSLCYFLPIIESIIRNPSSERDRVIALIVYPMNALVNSQLQSLEALKQGYESRTGQSFPVTFAKYTGETPDSIRAEMRNRPPQILLTNYVMAELFLVRPEDQIFFDRAGKGIRFLVFDELHTYRGRQGADVAMLIRRIKERCAAQGLVHIGTSATMISHPDATSLERQEAVASFAFRFFGHPFTPEQIIEETLSPITEGGPPERNELVKALSLPIPEDLELFRRFPLVRWVEYELGLEIEKDGKLKRRIPQRLSQLTFRLAGETGVDKKICEEAIREVLIIGGRLVKEDGNRALAFKIHQFIGQGNALYATFEDERKREFSLGGQIQS